MSLNAADLAYWRLRDHAEETQDAQPTALPDMSVATLDLPINCLSLKAAARMSQAKLEEEPLL